MKILIGSNRIAKILYFDKASAQLSEFENLEDGKYIYNKNSGLVPPSRFCCGMLCTFSKLNIRWWWSDNNSQRLNYKFICKRDNKNDNKYFFVSSISVSLFFNSNSNYIDVSDQISFRHFMVFLICVPLPVFCIFLLSSSFLVHLIMNHILSMLLFNL